MSFKKNLLVVLLYAATIFTLAACLNSCTAIRRITAKDRSGCSMSDGFSGIGGEHPAGLSR